MELRIQTFAALKDHFGAEFALNVEPGTTVQEIMGRLGEARPSAAELLASSRLAVGEDLVDPEYVPSPEEIQSGEFFLLPPASGG